MLLFSVFVHILSSAWNRPASPSTHPNTHMIKSTCSLRPSLNLLSPYNIRPLVLAQAWHFIYSILCNFYGKVTYTQKNTQISLQLDKSLQNEYPHYYQHPDSETKHCHNPAWYPFTFNSLYQHLCLVKDNFCPGF